MVIKGGKIKKKVGVILSTKKFDSVEKERCDLFKGKVKSNDIISTFSGIDFV